MKHKPGGGRSVQTINHNTMTFTEAATLFYTDLMNWFHNAVRFIPKFGVAILLLIAFTFLARWISRWVARGIHKFSTNLSLINLTRAITRVAVMAVGLFMALGVLGLDKAVTSLLAGAGVLALAIGFAFQDLTANFISGTMITLARLIQVGDVIETNGYTGQVLDVKLRSVVLDNFAGQTVEIPSKDVFQKPITNFTRVGIRRIEITAGISYLDDLNKAQQLAQDTVRALPFALKDRPVDLHFRAFGDNAVQFLIWFWINPALTSPPRAQSEAIKAVKAAFDTHDITFVFALHNFDLKTRLAALRNETPAVVPTDATQKTD